MSLAKRELFQTYEKLDEPMPMMIATDETIHATAIGNIDCLAHTGQEWTKLTVEFIRQGMVLHRNTHEQSVVLDKHLVRLISKDE
jgi:hypothetical protein